MKPYPVYRASGVEWLGMVPEGWEVVPIRRNVVLNPSKSETASRPRDEEVSFLPMEAVGENGELDLSRTRPIGEVETGYTYFRDGDMTFAKITPCFENGKRALMRGLVGGIGFGTTELTVLRPDGGRLLPEFLFWLVSSPDFRLEGEAHMYGAGGQKRVPDDFVRGFRVPVPPPTQQQAIAGFLDRETAKIDGLIEEQRRLIALLAEKRQATISHAVTRGLNPDASLKPSGVEWLGDIPERWEVVRLKSDLDYLTSGSRGWAEYYSDEGALFLRIGNLERESIALDLSDIQRVLLPDGAEGIRTRVASGDLLFSITAFLGSVAVVPPDMEEAYVSQHVALARLRQKSLLSVWVAYSTLSFVGKTYLASQGYGGTKLQLSLDDIANLIVLCPPLDEQSTIVAALEEHMARFDTLTETATSAITLLQERRAALISAAVTGKIDVREVAKVPARTSQSLHVSAMVAGVIIARHGQHPGFGRMMVQKFLFMTQACANAIEIGGNYERQAAGPLDRDLQNRVETDLEAAGLVRVRQEGGPGSRVQYEFLGDAAALRTELASALGDRMERFDYLSSQLGSLTKNGIEAVATLYAAWNDFLIDGRTPDRADIIREVLENWHPEKSKKFTKADLGIWLDWMERHDIVPNGTGPRTQTGRLFI